MFEETPIYHRGVIVPVNTPDPRFAINKEDLVNFLSAMYNELMKD